MSSKVDLEEAGFEAAYRLYASATGASSNIGRICASVLLGLFDGDRFPVDLKELRALPPELHNDVLAALRLDACVGRQRISGYFDGGAAKFEQLALRHRLVGRVQLMETPVKAPMRAMYEEVALESSTAAPASPAPVDVVPRLGVFQEEPGFYGFEVSHHEQLLDEGQAYSSIEAALRAGCQRSGPIAGYEVAYRGYVVGTYTKHEIASQASAIAARAVETARKFYTP
ncbi:MAG: hypothetical protein QM750_19785 [Rubrivivax sp.]